MPVIAEAIRNTSIIPVSSEQKKTIQFIGIGAAIFFTLSYTFYDLYLLPPRKIRHLPHWKYSDFIKSTILKRSEGNQKITLDDDDSTSQQKASKNRQTLNHSGITLRPDRLGWILHVSTPTGVKTILSKPEVFSKAVLGFGSKETIYHKFIGGSSVLTSDGEEYNRHRKTVNPAFHRSMPVQLFGQLTQKALAEIDRLEGVNVLTTDICMRLTLDVIGKAGFDFEFDATGNPNNEWVNVYQSVMEAMSDPIFFFFPFLDEAKWLTLSPKRQKIHHNLSRLLNMLSDLIKTKRELISLKDNAISETKSSETDLLTLMIESQAADKEGGLTDEEIRSNLCIFFFAGHETTSNALAFAIYNLAVNQDIQEIARQEAITILGDTPEDVLPSTEQLLKLPYILQIMKETMRMFGPVIDTAPRIAKEDTYIDGLFIPKDTFVTVNISNLHHNEKVWKSPDQFKPERFAPGGEFDQLSSDGINWAPFGGGKRQCIGMNFSLFEQRVILSMLLRKYTWSLPEDSIHKDKVLTTGIITISPVNLRINFKRRY